MQDQCYFCPALTKTKRKADKAEHETCVVLSSEFDVSTGQLAPMCPVEAYKCRAQNTAGIGQHAPNTASLQIAAKEAVNCWKAANKVDFVDFAIRMNRLEAALLLQA